MNEINDWPIGIGYNDEFNTTVAQIKSPRNPVLRLHACDDWVQCVYFRNYLLHHTIIY